MALQFHRTVYLDNVATPWLLAAFLLALSKRYQLAGFAASAVSFGIAVLSKETYLLALPFLAWMMMRNADKSTRRYTLSIAGSLLVLVGLGYVALAAVKGELLPGAGRVSLLEGIRSSSAPARRAARCSTPAASSSRRSRSGGSSTRCSSCSARWPPSSASS